MPENNLFNRFGPGQGNQGSMLPGPFGAISERYQQFNQFIGMLKGGNTQEQNAFAEQQMKQMLSSGQISQDMFNRAINFARNPFGGSK